MAPDLSYIPNQIRFVTNFRDLIDTPFQGEMNAMCWTRRLNGNFSEIANKVELTGNMSVIGREALSELELSEEGQLARNVLLNDLELLQTHGASPVLNLIRCYARDDAYPFFPTDVYSFHVDRSPVPTDTFLCTYHGAPSEILPNSQARQKVLIPEIRNEIKELYGGTDEEFESFLIDNYFDLHYSPLPDANIISLGRGHLWRLAVDYPQSKALPCIHRAPEEKNGTKRLLMIC